jgi:hypothetical protein
MARRVTAVTSAAPESVTSGSSNPGLTRLRAIAPALIYAAYLAGALIVTWHLWAHPGVATVAGNRRDSAQFAWFLRYEATAIMHGRLPPLVTTAMNPPRGISMMWNTTLLLPGALLSPVTVLAGPQASLTVLLTLGFAGSAASLFYVLRRYGASLPAAAVGGAVYGFSPALLHAAQGHYQLQLAILPPLIIDAALRLFLRVGHRIWTGVWLGLLLTAQVFIGEEILFETVLAGIVLAVVLAVSRPRRVLAAVTAALPGLGVAAGVLLLLAGFALERQFFGPLVETGSPFTTDFYKNYLEGFVTPSSSQLLHTSASAAAAAQYPGLPPEYLAYLGWPLIAALVVLTVWCWRRLPARACAVTAAVLLLLSVGAHPMGGFHSTTPLTSATLPWGWAEQLPLLNAGLPNRLSIVADGAVAALLAFGIDRALAWLRGTRLSQRWAAAIVGVAVAAVVLPLVPAPLPAQPADPLPAGWAATLASLRLRPWATVLVVPVPTDQLTAALRWEADGGQPISLVGGYYEGPYSPRQGYIDGFEYPAAEDGHAGIDGGAVPLLTSYLDDYWAGHYSIAPDMSVAQVTATLAWWKPSAVIAQSTDRARLIGYLEHLFGRPTLRRGTLLAWRLHR